MKTRKQILLCSEGRVIKNVSLTTRSEKTTVEDHQKFIAQSFSKDVTRYPFLARFVKNWSFCSNKKKKSPEKMIVRIHLRRYGH